MIAIPLGKISVPTPGTPVAISLSPAQVAQLSPGGLVTKIEARTDPADTGAVYVKQGGVTIAALPQPANGFAAKWGTPECEGNSLQPLAFSVDAAQANNGPFVTLWVE